jgi:DNA polymerase (family 10)
LDNRHIAAAFRELADLMDLAGEDRFRVSAYRRASDTIRHESRPLAEMKTLHALQTLPGIGPAIAAEIQEMLTTGRYRRLEEMRAAMPAIVIALMHVPGIGPKTAAQLHATLQLPDLPAYERAFQAGALRGIKGIGARREAEILSGLRARIVNEGRILLGTGVAIAAQLMADFTARLPGVTLTPVGSLRRWSPTLGDVDLLAATDDPDAALDTFAALPDVLRVVAREPDRVRVYLIDGAEAECVTRPPRTAGGALLWLTGDKTTPERLGFREAFAAHATERGFTLDTMGLRRGETFVEGDEQAAFDALGLPFIPPELREGGDALEQIIANGLPRLVGIEDIRGDLHTHTVWSDGNASVAEMAAAARERGYQYYGVSDHSHSLRIANGLDAARLRQQAEEIAVVADIRVLRACEIEVHNDGHLDLDDSALAALDYAIASVHSGQRGDRAVVTARTLAAIANPYVDIIAHPTGRMPLHREPMDLDFEAVFAEAARTETALEINADSHRLDLDAPLAKQAAAAGVVITINSDAHSTAGLGNMPFGVMTARRAWLTPEQILNCWPGEDILARRARRIG